MYTPPHFAAPHAQACTELLRAHPLGTVVWQNAAGLQATPLPWLLRTAADGSQRLVGHVARANPLLQALAAGPLNVLVVFQGPQGYISPNWYPSKAETHKMVPTWNYATVHAHGLLQARPEPDWLRGLLTELTARFEASEPRPWTLDEAAPGHVDQLLRVIAGLELEVQRLDGKFKLGQNRELRDQQGAIAALRASGEPGALALAAAMQAVLPAAQ